MNRREDLQQFFISANTSQDKHGFDFEKFTNEYLIRNPDVVKKNDLSHLVVGSFTGLSGCKHEQAGYCIYSRDCKQQMDVEGTDDVACGLAL